jgi:hypothetical protein
MIISRAASRLNSALYRFFLTSGFSFSETPVSTFLRPHHQGFSPERKMEEKERSATRRMAAPPGDAHVKKNAPKLLGASESEL